MTDNRVEKLNYFICRCADIEFYANQAVFQTKFKGGYDTEMVHNLEDFQEEYLNKIQNCITQILEFLEEEHDKELTNDR